ncbi:phosphonate C-P lyase system protein PhnL [Aliagarivorans marinus]|uniref:phosphonate C-P lyase system protein PhnL n=1 Tax=Aliagarivorans marinus TaxID=561965 RepID=UPI000415CFCC|nr:phosphonate C-P lyase system protein PhnL [Aliagarivorans marinus]
METMLRASEVSKRFVLHNQGGVELPVLKQASFSVNQGECLVLNGRSGSGKSTLLRALYGNYLVDSGRIEVKTQGYWLDIASATPRAILQLRRNTIGWVSQFLRVIPRVSALDVVMQPLLDVGGDAKHAKHKAQQLLERLNVPSHLWALAPATFSGGEQQRVNIARGFILDYPVLLLDEPTASLDSTNASAVVELIDQAKQRGAAVVGIFHDSQVREQVADRLYDLSTQDTTVQG